MNSCLPRTASSASDAKPLNAQSPIMVDLTSLIPLLKLVHNARQELAQSAASFENLSHREQIAQEEAIRNQDRSVQKTHDAAVQKIVGMLFKLTEHLA